LFVLEEQLGSDPWECASGFRSNLPARKRVLLRRGKKELQVDIGDDAASVNATVLSLGAVHEEVSGAVNARIDGHNRHARVLRDANFLYVMCEGHTERFIELTDDMSRYQNQALSRGGIAAPMPGQVIAVNVKAGDVVKQGDVLVVVEAMKMEHSVSAPQAGTVKKVMFAPGDRVEEGAELVELE
jgi:3-methylcrotonyl-CoA carboxylase alpha subunit